jgi:hypothetical protein
VTVPESLGRAGSGSGAFVINETGNDTVVYVAFGSDSVVLPSDWSSFCTATAMLNCNFPLKSMASQPLPLSGRYLNATLTFGGPVSCHSTKAELNLNNPKWYDIADVSLVDGYSDKISITIETIAAKPGVKAEPRVLGPPKGATGNEKVFGVYPLGCDICVARERPPCGMSPGKSGCKSGSQYKPDVPCQYQGQTMGGGDSTYKVALTK